MKDNPLQPDDGACLALSGRYFRPSEHVIAASGLSGIAGIAFLPLTLALRRPATLTVKIAAYLCPVLLGSSLLLESVGPRNPDASVQRRGPKKRSTKLSELVDLRILGASAGVLIAARRNLLSLRGWQKWIGLFSVGSGLGELGQNALHRSQTLQYVQKFHEDREALQHDFARYVRHTIEVGRRGYLYEVFQEVPVGPSGDQGPSRPNVDAFAMTQADLERQLLPGGRVSQVNTRDGPHVAATEPGETELMPMPHTNYDWMVPSQHVVPELEHHITKLRAHRAKLSTEAQIIWEWLREKEAQYYQIRDSDTAVGYDAEQHKKQLHEYCQTLASEHLVLWIAVGKIDWIIADSQKRIAQHRQFSRGQYQVSSQSDSTKISSSLSFVLWRLQNKLELLDNEVQNHAKTVALLESDLRDPSLPHMPEPVRSSLRAAPKKDRERIVRGLIEEGKSTQQQLVVQKVATEEVLRDGERKAKIDKDGNA